ncbi:MAG: hypothetical protein HQM09_22555 [Candidatus Riflebacteria bacterium]|nr:hypothetical protein [Candidatus Riflebacteria bacterium]
MPRIPMTELISSIEGRDWSDKMIPENEVEFEIDMKHADCLIGIDPELVQEMKAVAREKKTTLRKLLESWLRQNLRKLKAA